MTASAHRPEEDDAYRKQPKPDPKEIETARQRLKRNLAALGLGPRKPDRGDSYEGPDPVEPKGAR